MGDFSAKRYKQGGMWFLLSLLISAINDVLAKLLVDAGMHFWHIVFGRLFVSLVSFLPYMVVYPGLLRTKRMDLHALRGGLFVLAIGLWNYGFLHNTNTTATVMSFTLPVFVCMLGVVFLREKPTVRLIVSTIMCFCGIFIIFYLKGDCTYNGCTWAFVVASILFASLDVINKYQLEKEFIHTMVFYSNVVGVLIVLPFAWRVDGAFPRGYLMMYLILLGCGSNAIILCVLRAYQCASPVVLAPLRYVELLISVFLSVVVLGVVPYYECLGALVIIPAVVFLSWKEVGEIGDQDR